MTPQCEAVPALLAGPVNPVWCPLSPAGAPSTRVDFVGRWFLRHAAGPKRSPASLFPRWVEAPQDLQRFGAEEVEAGDHCVAGLCFCRQEVSMEEFERLRKEQKNASRDMSTFGYRVLLHVGLQV